MKKTELKSLILECLNEKDLVEENILSDVRNTINKVSPKPGLISDCIIIIKVVLNTFIINPSKYKSEIAEMIKVTKNVSTITTGKNVENIKIRNATKKHDEEEER
jgi:hypothetical protein